jgi:hypothetical protein
MTNSEMIVLFALAMLALALVAIAVDWVGKPIHRRFIPKIYRYPEELAPPPDPSVTQWSDDTFRIPENPPDDAPIEYSDGSTEWSDAVLVIPEITGATATTPPMFAEFPDQAVEADHAVEDDAPEAESTGPEPQADPADSEPDEAPEPVDPPELPPRSTGWRPGQYVFNRTRSGNEPSPDAIRRRFWKNVGVSDHVVAFGALNAQRLAAGQPPVRRNARTGAMETMTLRVTDYHRASGRAPSPTWNDNAVDPYAVS